MEKTVLELPAGSELDKVVAELVFGSVPCDKWEIQRQNELGVSHWKDENACEHEACHPVGFPRRYSSDIAAAWGVVERFFNDSEYFGLELSVERMLDGWGWCCNIAGVEAMADTASLAICRAALKVLGSQE